MNRYFLHIDSDDDSGGGGDDERDRQGDEQGSEFVDDRLALGQAAMTAGELLRDLVGAKPGNNRVRVVVEDEQHRTIGAVEASLRLDDRN